MSERPAWHAGAAGRLAVARVVTDLVADEAARLRPGLAGLPPRPWDEALALDERGLGLDSLERLTTAAALADALNLRASGLEDLLLAQRCVGGWIDIAQRALAVDDSRLIFRTSGSTGDPEPCEHTLAGLLQEVAVLSELLGQRRRVLSFVPAHHIYGFLFTVLLPWRLGIAVVDLRASAPQSLGRHAQPGDLVVTHPMHAALLARHAGPLPEDVVGVTSTAPCPAEVHRALTRPQRFARLVQVYGSSQTAGVGWRDDPDAPYTLMPYWRRHERDDAKLRRAPDDTEVAAQDHLVWQDARRFVVTGRRDQAVQVGGVNVFPARIAALLETHPDVAAAAVRRMAPHEGERLKAFIVPREGADPDRLARELPAWADGRLRPAERPRAWRFGAALPVNAQGKACDWILEDEAVAAG